MKNNGARMPQPSRQTIREAKRMLESEHLSLDENPAKTARIEKYAKLNRPIQELRDQIEEEERLVCNGKPMDPVKMILLADLALMDLLKSNRQGVRLQAAKLLREEALKRMGGHAPVAKETTEPAEKSVDDLLRPS